MSDGSNRIAYAVGGIVLGGLLVYGALRAGRGDEDEDRPPIIVKGGSLIFESGDADSSDPGEKTGKAWVQHNNDWQPNQKKGKKVKWLVVGLPTGDQATCPALSMTKDIVVTYTTTAGAASSFTITRKARPGGGGPATAISGTGLMQGGTAGNPRLIYDQNGGGTISKVEFLTQNGVNVVCTTARSLKVWQF